MKIAVTVGKNNLPQLSIDAMKWAKDLNLQYVQRESKGTLDKILQENNLDAIIVATAQGAQLHSPSGKLFFHPSMGLLRIKNLLEGKTDRLIKALDLQKSMSALDCTLGLGTDSLVMSYIVSDTGKIVALEASKEIAFIVSQGMVNYKTSDNAIKQALNNIQIVNATAQNYLQTLPDKSFDVVYFDPMFEKTITKSNNMQPLTNLAYKQPIDKQTIYQALKIARRKVVIKVPHYKEQIDGLQLNFTNDGKYSSVKYAVFEVGNEQ